MTPDWGILYDADFRIWVAVRGWDQMVAASTPAKLVHRIGRAALWKAPTSPPDTVSKPGGLADLPWRTLWVRKTGQGSRGSARVATVRAAGGK